MSEQPPGSVLELISNIRHAQSRMSVHNPNRALFTVCIAALTDLSLQLAESKKNEGGIPKEWRGMYAGNDTSKRPKGDIEGAPV